MIKRKTRHTIVSTPVFKNVMLQNHSLLMNLASCYPFRASTELLRLKLKAHLLCLMSLMMSTQNFHARILNCTVIRRCVSELNLGFYQYCTRLHSQVDRQCFSITGKLGDLQWPRYGHYTATIRPLQNLRLANGGRPKQRSGGPGQWKCYTFKRPGSWGMPRRTLRRWRVVVAEARLGDELALSGGIRGEPTLRDCVTQGKIILQRASSQPKLGALFLVGACLKPIKKKSSN